MKLAYDLRGSGPTVIILHGLFGSKENWTTMAEWLSQDYRVCTMDLRNHGESPHAQTMGYEEMAADVFETLEDLAKGPVVLLGHSMGGKVAMVGALRFPALVGHLIVADIAPREYPSTHESILRALEEVEAAEIGSRREAEEILARHIDSRAVRLFLLKNLTRVEADRYRLRLNVDAISRCYDEIRTWRIEAESYNGPVLVLRGERSSYVPHEDPGMFRPWFPHTRVRTIAGTSHWLHAEAPEAFRNEVLAFLDS